MGQIIDTPEAVEAASFLARPVVSIAQARETLRRPRTGLQAAQTRHPVRPALTIGNVVLGAFFEALLDASPAFAGTVIDTLEDAALAAQANDPGGDASAVAFAALAWLRDLRAPVTAEPGEG